MLVNTKKRIIRLRYLKSTAMGNKKFLKEVTEIFIVQIPEEISLLEKLLIEKDWILLSDLAHKMKLSLNVMGMKQSEKLLIDIETAISNSSTPDESFLTAKLKTLKVHCLQAVEEVKEIMVEWAL
jgi:HPt (histidine-containing phosphotransfer) domain-containing protein